MNVRKFIAATAREALHKVKELLGADAIILSNRSIPGGVEIMAVAAGDMEAMVAPRPPARVDEDYTVRLSTSANAVAAARPAGAPDAAARPVPPLAPRPAPQLDRQPPAAPDGAENKSQAEIITVEMMAEIRSLRKIVEQHLAGAAWSEGVRSEPVKSEILRQMLDAGFSPAFARDLLAGLPRAFNAAQAQAWVKVAADRALKTLAADDDIIDRGGIYALVGPTGVGKTTTAAKLAARCVLRHGAGKLALVTTDGYRIGAYEQLRIYGRILGVSVYLAKDAQELRQVIADLQHKHMVLIDTMGMSQRDQRVVEQAAMFGDVRVRRLLLLAATGRGDTLDDVVRAYGGAELAGCILSKIDEAASLAPVLDTVIRHKLRLHYVANGQRVPEDLHLPNRAYLLHRAFKSLPEASPHRLESIEPGLLMSSSAPAAAVAGGRHA